MTIPGIKPRTQVDCSCKEPHIILQITNYKLYTKSDPWFLEMLYVWIPVTAIFGLQGIRY